MSQVITENVQTLVDALADRPFLLVCGSSYASLSGLEKLNQLPHTVFSDFTPNPRYEQVVQGVAAYRHGGCQQIVAVGGGSALDVAKCIALFSGMDEHRHYLDQPLIPNQVPLYAIPTTAGTGSESTRHAVIYRDGVKQSISHESIIPQMAVLMPELLDTLPLYQKKCTMLDALCQAIESWWSVAATEESVSLAKRAVSLILEAMSGYLAGSDRASARKMLHGANLAGQAINLTATTAAHAMSYQLTSLYGLPHGHAVAVCMGEVWQFLREKAVSRAEIANILREIEQLLTLEAFEDCLAQMEICLPVSRNKAADLPLLVSSVNPTRLKNMRVLPTEGEITAMYERIVQE